MLEAGAVRRLGATRSQAVDVWIITATNEDLSAAVAGRRFREDLYFRLAVMTFTLPPLRERGSDVTLLADRFLAKFCAAYGLSATAFDDAARAALRAHDWPGNIRELSNIVERAILLSDGPVITTAALQLPDSGPRAEAPPIHLHAPSPDAVARQELLEALTKTDWNISRAAALLGLTRNTVRARVKRFDLRPADPTFRPLTGRPRRAGADRLAGHADARGMAHSPVQAPVALRWDRRRVALLRVDIGEAGKTPTAPLEWGGTLRVIIEKILSFGGSLQDVSLDGVEALFGLEPIEDAPRRAAHAGLAIRRELAWPPDDAQTPPSRVAIHTEEVPVVHAGDAVRIDGRTRRRLGPTMDALLAGADAGTIVVSAATAAFLRRRFVLKLAPRSHPELPIYELVGHEQINAGPAEKGARFVGRQREMALLQACMASALAGHGQLAVVIGEAGIGKSRLVWELAHTGLARTMRILETGSAYAAITPSLPVIELLRRHIGVAAEDGPERIRQRVDAAVLAGDGSLRPARPALLALLGAPEPDWIALDPVERRHQTRKAAKQVILVESTIQPLLVVFEDVHWIDSESQALLDALVEELPAARILLVVTCRPGYHHRWGELSYFTPLAIGPLSTDLAGDMLEDLVGHDASLAMVRPRLVEWTGGNPFFIEESVQGLIGTGVLKGNRGEYRAARHAPAGPVPATVDDILAARIDRLTVEDKTLLQAVAAIGREAPAALLAEISGLSREALARCVRRLQAAEFLFEAGTATGDGLVFKHVLTREVAYRSLLPGARVDLHRRIVEAIEATTGATVPEHLDRLAHHAFRAELWPKAIGYLRQAADRAMGSAASREATEYLEQALDALHHLPQTGRVLEDLIDVRLRLRDALWPQLRLSSILDHLTQAQAIAESLYDRRRQGWVACYLSHYYWSVGDLQQALAAGDRALAVARDLRNVALLAETNFYRGIAQLAQGDLRRAVDTLSESLRDVEDAVPDRAADFPSPRFVLLGPVLVRG